MHASHDEKVFLTPLASDARSRCHSSVAMSLPNQDISAAPYVVSGQLKVYHHGIDGKAGLVMEVMAIALVQ